MYKHHFHLWLCRQNHLTDSACIQRLLYPYFELEDERRECTSILCEELELKFVNFINIIYLPKLTTMNLST